MTDESAPGPAPRDGSMFRGIVGLTALGVGLIAVVALFFVEIPQRNEQALLIALGIVLGWGSSVVSSEYGASATGRKAADAAIKQVEGAKP